jgi:hypothetical protein
MANNFSFNLDGNGVPYVIGECLRSGGKPESIIPEEVALLSSQKLYLNNLHYQGDSKRKLAYDICRILVLTNTKKIRSEYVRMLCEKELQKYPGMPCLNRTSVVDNTIQCI